MQRNEPQLIRHFVRSAQLRADLLHNGYMIITQADMPDGTNVTHLRHRSNGRKLCLLITAAKTELREGEKILKTILPTR